MSSRVLTAIKAGIGGLLCLLYAYALVLGVHVLEQIYPCRAVDPETGVSRAVSCIHTPSPEIP